MMVELAAHQIALYIEDASIPLVLDLSNRVTLGRHSSRDTKVSPTISLNSYNAFNHGISRVHATMYYDPVLITAVVVDEYSTNGTWVNGQRIAPMVPTPIENKDELRLSRLRMLIIAPTKQTAVNNNSSSHQID
jgi:pSer/pThr/pTyr-binding forkhead associated (FHA) protein